MVWNGKLKGPGRTVVPRDSTEKCNEEMEGELNLKCLSFNYKCSASKQLFLTAGHQLHGVTEVFRQEINKWDFFLGREKPLHNGRVSSPRVPSHREPAGVQGSKDHP